MPTGKFFLKDLTLFVFILILCVILPLAGGQYYEHATNPGSIAVLKGVFSTSPSRLSNNDGQWIFIHYLFWFFYTLCPGIDWYGIMMVFSCSLFLFIFIKIIKLTYINNKSLPQLTVLVIVMLLQFENIALLDFTRPAFFLSFIGLLLMLTSMESAEDSGGNNSKLFLPGFFSFVFGCLIRHQPGILSLILILPLAAIYIKRKRLSLFRFSKYMAPVFFVVVFLQVLMGIRWDKGYDKTPEYGGYLISLWDVDNETKTVHLSTKEDSLIYHLVKDLHFFSDPKNINPDFFKKIGVPYTDKKIQSFSVILSNKVNYSKKFKEQGLYYINEHIGLVLFLFAVAGLAIFSSTKGKIRVEKSVLLLLTGYIFLYFFIAVFLKMEERIFCPMAISICTVFALLIDTDNNLLVKTRPVIVLWFLLLLSFAGIELLSFEKLFTARKEEVKYIESIFDTLSARSEKYQFIDQISDQIYLYPFQKDPLRKDKFYPTIDNYGFFVCPTYDDKMKLITGGRDTKEYLEFVASHPNDCIVVSERKRLEELLNYFNYMYHLNLKFYPVINDLRQNYKGESNLHPFGLFKVTF